MQRHPMIKKTFSISRSSSTFVARIRSKNQITRKIYIPEDKSSALTKACNGDDDNDESHLAPAAK